MHKLCLLVAFALLSHEALGFRLKRQSENKEELDDRYGWNRPNQGSWQGGWQYPEPSFPGNFPWQNPRPTQRPNVIPGQQFPRPNPGQGQVPRPNPGQGQLPQPNPGQGQNPGQVNPTTSSPSTGDATAIQNCRRTCLVTPEYNPVCGSDNQTYDNPGLLLCAQACGANVTQVRESRCPNAVLPPVA